MRSDANEAQSFQTPVLKERSGELTLIVESPIVGPAIRLYEWVYFYRLSEEVGDQGEIDLGLLENHYSKKVGHEETIIFDQRTQVIMTATSSHDRDADHFQAQEKHQIQQGGLAVVPERRDF